MMRRAWALPLTAVLLLSSVVWVVARNLPALLGPPLPLDLHQVRPAPAGSRFVLLAQEHDHPYWQTIRRGAEQAARDNGVSVDYGGPWRHSPAEHLQLLDQAVAAQVDGIITPGLDATGYDAYIAKAVDRGIPVVTVESDAPASRRLAYVGSDNLAAGRLLATAVAEATGGSGEVGVLVGGSTVPGQAFRLEGLRAGLSAYPDLQIVAVHESEFSRVVATQKAWTMLQEYPNLAAIVGLSAYDAAGAAQAVLAAGRAGTVQVVGVGDLPEAPAQMSPGPIYAIVTADPYTMGYRAVAVLAGYLRDQRPPPVIETAISLRRRGDGQ